MTGQLLPRWVCLQHETTAALYVHHANVHEGVQYRLTNTLTALLRTPGVDATHFHRIIAVDVARERAAQD